MYGTSMKCDVCNTIAFVDYADNLLLADAIAPSGWIRIHVNQPYAWNWNRDKARKSTFEYAADCCSITCARSILAEASDAIPGEAGE